MSSVLPLTGLYHLGVVAPDCQKSMANFSRIFGIPRWDVQVLKNEDFGDPRVHGRDVPQHFMSALAIGGPISFEICQPLAGDKSVYSEFLDDGSVGLHHTHASIVTLAEFETLQPEIEKSGVKVAQSAIISDTVDYYYYDTQDKLGTLAELLVLKGPDPRGGEPRVVEFGPDVTHHADRLPIDKLYHYTVTADQPAEQFKRNYEWFYGFEDWFSFKNRPDDTVKNSRYMGQPEDYRFRTYSGRRGALGVEIVEPEGGSSIFSEKLNRSGPGMHHIMTTIMRQSHFERTIKWLRNEGIDVAQDAWTPDGSAYICFLDARERLDGMYIEVIVQRDDAPEMIGREADIMIGR